MIKRMIGLIVTVAVLFVLVMTILHAGSYRSMIWDRSDRPAAAVTTPGRTSDDGRDAVSSEQTETAETGGKTDA